MRQRVEHLGGEFAVSSHPGSGTSIEVFVPATAAARS
jgi:signal transduction histidine kinase